MKRYIVFLYESEESGGWFDVISNKNGILSFDTIGEAIVKANRVFDSNAFLKTCWETTRQVVDLKTGKVVEYSRKRPEQDHWKNIL